MMSETEFAKSLLENVLPIVHMLRGELKQAAAGVLTFPQIRVLGNINRGLATVSEIAEHHGVSQPAMTKMVNGLVKRGLVQRKPNPSDVRQILLTLTPKGKRLRQKTLAAAQKRIGKRLRSVPPEQREQIVRAIVTLTNAI